MEPNNTNMNPAPVSPTPTPATPKNSENGVGPVVGIIVILLVIVLGGLYFWSKRVQAPTDGTNQVTTDETANSIRATSNSDDTASLEADLNNTSTDVSGDIEAIQ